MQAVTQEDPRATQGEGEQSQKEEGGENGDYFNIVPDTQLGESQETDVDHQDYATLKSLLRKLGLLVYDNTQAQHSGQR